MLKLIAHQKNLVYCVPTSGGKTLVAELMIMREMLLNKKDALFVFPFVSIVQEKIRSLISFSFELDFVIEEYANDKGSIPVRKRKKPCLYIATIEKAHLLLTCLLEEKRLNEIGMIVVDELHMLGDGTKRGCTLESFLLLSMIAKRKKYFNARLIAMSATLNNFEQISRFLKAEIEENNFRPVDLIEYVKVDSSIYKYIGDKEDEFLKYERSIKTEKALFNDPDNLSKLVQESIPHSPLLIFCPTKTNCENVVKLLASHLPKRLKVHKSAERKLVLKNLQELNNYPVCPTLQIGIPFGIAYHHSGLTTDERSIVENSFLNGTLCCIVCTSTLAAGVNLPAQRVIIRSPYVAKDFISSSQYKQMIGRAGRAGLSENGESVLMVKEADKDRIRSLMVNVQNECVSSMKNNLETGISRIFLALFHLRLVKNFDEIRDVILNETLYGIQFGHQDDAAFIEILNQQLNRFYELNLIEKPEDDQSEIKLTKLGKGAIKGLIDIDKCNRLYQDLLSASKDFCLNSKFHLLYICTTIFDSEELPPNPDAEYIHNKFFKLNTEEKYAASRMKITEGEVYKYLELPYTTDKAFQDRMKRFFFTLVLYESYKGQLSLADLSVECKIARGTLQHLFSRFATNSMSLLRFIEELNEFWGLRQLLNGFVGVELSLCANPEIVPLLELPQVKVARAKRLFNTGYKTLEKIAESKPIDLFNCFEQKATMKVCSDIIKFAKQAMVDKAESMHAEAEYYYNLGKA